MITPQDLDFLDRLVRIVGWPTFLLFVIRAVRTFDKGQAQARELSANTKLAVEKVTKVEADVLNLRDNHLQHLQTGIDNVAASNEKAATSLSNIDTNIKILVDRLPR